MPRFKSIIFYQYSPKIKLFLKKKCKIFKGWGLRFQTPMLPKTGGVAPRPLIASGSWGLCPQTSKTAPNCKFLATCLPHICTIYNHMGVLSICFEQFFLDRLVANLMILTIDVCLMLNYFLFETFYLHYALCDFDSILLHCTNLFIRQSVDREQIFDVIFQPPY